MKKHLFLVFIFLLISLGFIFIFYSNIAPNKFIFIGDQFFRFGYHETFINSFFIRKLENLGVLNGWQFTTQFWDVLYYLLVYRLNLSMIWAEKFLFFIVLFLSLYLSFLGFKKLSFLISNKQSSLIILVVTLWYCFNPYTVILWHGGVYNLGSGLTYSLAPLILYYYHTSVFLRSSLKVKIICALLMGIASFTFWLFAPLVFIMITYSLFYLLFNVRRIPEFLKNIFILLLMYIPLISFVLFNIMYEYFRNAGNNNSTFMPTFGNEQGGIWYQILMLFSWGIYTVWTPRSMYSFHKYYFSSSYINATLAIYIFIFIGLLKHFFIFFVTYLNNNKKFFHFIPKHIFKFIKRISQTRKSDLQVHLLIIFLLLLFISLFLAKAGQPPYGEIFLYLYDNVPFFTVFRTADIRFGFSVVLSIAILFLLISREFNKYVVILAISIILMYQSPFLFNGKAIQGENINGLFYDRILYYPKDYKDAINYLNKDKSLSTYVLPLPAIEYGNYAFDKGERHFGQDLLSKLVHKPFVYLSLSNGISTKTYNEIKNVIQNKQYERLRKFPIKYLILRRDVGCTDCANLSEEDIGNRFKKVIKNKTFIIYELNNYPAVINVPQSSFTMINPVKYKVRFYNVSKIQSLELLTSFNKDWRIYIAKIHKTNCTYELMYSSSNTKECIIPLKYFEGDELSYLWRKPLFENTHTLSQGYANTWKISPEYIKNNFSKELYSVNKDGTINFELVLYFKPQSYFYITLIISVLSLGIYSLYLVRSLRNRHN